MPDILRCPACDRRLSIPDSATARKALCPACGHSWWPHPEVLPAEEPAPQQQSEDSREESAEAERASWEKVRRGLGLLLLSLPIAVAAPLVALFVSALVSATVANSFQGQPVDSTLIGLWCGGTAYVVLLLAHLIPGLLGHLDGLAIPGGRGRLASAASAMFFLASVVIWVGAATFHMIHFRSLSYITSGDPDRNLMALLALYGLVWILSGARLLAFVLVLRAVARGVGAHGLRQTLLIPLVATALGLATAVGLDAWVFVRPLLTGKIMRVGTGEWENVLLLPCCFGVVVAPAVVIWVIVSMFVARSAITLHLDEGERFPGHRAPWQRRSSAPGS